jgi:hypothetical protein
MVYNRADVRWAVNRSIILASSGLILIALASMSPAIFAAQSTTGSVTYTITVNTPSGSRTLTINETVSSSHKAGLSDLVLRLTSAEENLTYSRLVNASENYLPYLPTLANESFSFSRKFENHSIDFSFTSTGTSTVTFQGKTYQMKVYTAQFSVSSAMQTHRGSALLTVFASGLVYSLKASVDGKYSYEAVLTAGSNSLADPPAQTPIVGYAALGAGVAAIALVASVIIKQRRHNVHTDQEKPLHWVD